MIQELLPYILTFLNSAVSIIVVILQYARMAKEFKFSFNDAKEQLKEAKSQVVIAMKENAELKNQMNELLTKLDHIERK